MDPQRFSPHTTHSRGTNKSTKQKNMNKPRPKPRHVIHKSKHPTNKQLHAIHKSKQIQEHIYKSSEEHTG